MHFGGSKEKKLGKSGQQKGEYYECGARDYYSRNSGCPARGKECAKCHKKDHFAKVCRTKQVNSIGAGGQEDTSGDQSDTGAHEHAFRIGINSVNADDLLEVEEGGVKLQVLADSGVKLRSVVSSYKC